MAGGNGTNGHATNGTNGHSRLEDKVRVAIIGVGNCASSLVQGVQYYQNAPDDEFVPGLMHVDLGGYHIRDIEFTAAFDIDVEQGRQGPQRGDLRRAEQHVSSSPTCRTWACRSIAA